MKNMIKIGKKSYAVHPDSVSVGGLVVRRDLYISPADRCVVVMPNGRAAMDEDGRRPHVYANLDEAIEDVELTEPAWLSDDAVVNPKARSGFLVRREGFWFGDRCPGLPAPISPDHTWPGRNEFLEALSKVEAVAEESTTRGFSICRICGKANGSREFDYKGWRWPSGYAHYIRDHNVRPSLAFQEFVLWRLIDS